MKSNMIDASGGYCMTKSGVMSVLTVSAVVGTLAIALSCLCCHRASTRAKLQVSDTTDYMVADVKYFDFVVNRTLLVVQRIDLDGEVLSRLCQDPQLKISPLPVRDNHATIINISKKAK